MTRSSPSATSFRGTTNGNVTDRSGKKVRSCARPAGPPPTSPGEPVTVQRVVCSRGHFQIVDQKIQVGRIHARKILVVTGDNTDITIHDNGEPIRIVPRTTTQEITRIKSQAHTKKRKIG